MPPRQCQQAGLLEVMGVVRALIIVGVAVQTPGRLVLQALLVIRVLLVTRVPHLLQYVGHFPGALPVMRAPVVRAVLEVMGVVAAVEIT